MPASPDATNHHPDLLLLGLQFAFPSATIEPPRILAKSAFPYLSTGHSRWLTVSEVVLMLYPQ